MKEKTIILGAGIAGLTTAITLARHNQPVEVYEKTGYPGGTMKQDFQGFRNFGTSDHDVLEEFNKLGVVVKPHLKITRVTRHSLHHRFTVHSNHPQYYIISRGSNPGSIDRQLADQVEQAGGQIHYNQTRSKDQVDVIATGWYKQDVVGYGYIFEDTQVGQEAHVFITRRYSPVNGYLYIIPGLKKGEAEILNVLIGQQADVQDAKLSLDKAMAESRRLTELFDGSILKNVQTGVSCSTIRTPLYDQGRYYVGEAAGLQDKSAGFGMRYAILSGYLAGRAILDSLDYDLLIRDRLGVWLTAEQKRYEAMGNMTDDGFDKVFAKIIGRFGNDLTLEDYKSIRGKL